MINSNKGVCKIEGDVITVTDDMLSIIASLTKMYGKKKVDSLLNFVENMNTEELFTIS